MPSGARCPWTNVLWIFEASINCGKALCKQLEGYPQADGKDTESSCPHTEHEVLSRRGNILQNEHPQFEYSEVIVYYTLKNEKNIFQRGEMRGRIPKLWWNSVPGSWIPPPPPYTKLLGGWCCRQRCAVWHPAHADRTIYWQQTERSVDVISESAPPAVEIRAICSSCLNSCVSQAVDQC